MPPWGIVMCQVQSQFLKAPAILLSVVFLTCAGKPSGHADEKPSAPAHVPAILGKLAWGEATIGRGIEPSQPAPQKLAGSTVLNPEAENLLNEALALRATKAGILIPAMIPITTTNKVIYRGYGTVYAVDVKSGELEWESIDLQGSFNSIMSDTNKKQQVVDWCRAYKEGANQNILFENSAVGTLSTDNARVYAVDDLAMPPHPAVRHWNFGWRGGGPQVTGSIAPLAERGRLIAIDLETGKLLWEHGDPEHDNAALAMSYYLGPPLPLEGKLYVVTEKAGQLRLFCLDPDRGNPLWSQVLPSPRKALMDNPGRRMQAIHLVNANGLLICPTHAGQVVGYDLRRRAVRWIFCYREDRPEFDYPMVPTWKNSAVSLAGSRAVFTAPDGPFIYCLNLRDGTLAWRANCRDDLYLAGVCAGRVLLVGKSHCRALSLLNGQDEWRTEIGIPSGRGALSGGLYYVPLRAAAGSGKPAVWALQPATGHVVARFRTPNGLLLGNLLFHDDALISQSATAVMVLRPLAHLSTSP